MNLSSTLVSPPKSTVDSFYRGSPIGQKVEADQMSLSESMTSNAYSSPKKRHQKDIFMTTIGGETHLDEKMQMGRARFLSPIAETSIGMVSNEPSRHPLILTASPASNAKLSLPVKDDQNMPNLRSLIKIPLTIDLDADLTKPKNYLDALRMKAEREAREKEPKRSRNLFEMPAVVSIKSAEGFKLNNYNEKLLKDPTMQKVVIRDQLLVLANKFFTIKSQLTDEGFQEMVNPI